MATVAPLEKEELFPEASVSVAVMSGYFPVTFVVVVKVNDCVPVLLGVTVREPKTLVGCGRSLADQQIVIVDPQKQTRCRPGEIGEAWIAGPSVANGYWDQPELSRQTFAAHLAESGEGPFLRTGDLGFLEHNELFITGGSRT